jgi:8-oxo-dGTP pyrophosphatase MutT (NUDIX family)
LARAQLLNVNEVQRRVFSIAVYPRFKGKILLIFHKRLQKWLPPGGELLPDETPQEAAIRELNEETGLTGKFPRISFVQGVPDGLLGYEEHVAGSKGLHMNFVFVADVDTDVVNPNQEFEEFRWVTLDEGPWEGAPPNVRDFAVLALSS